jgi:hypothetical protein
MSSVSSSPSFTVGFGPVTCVVMDIENPKIPEWIHKTRYPKNLYIDGNSGLVTLCIDDGAISIMGTWNNDLQKYDEVTANTKLYVKALESMGVNCVIEPVEMAWLTDVTLSCLDRDVLVVKRCLSNRSVALGKLLEDSNVLDLDYNSDAIIIVMRAIHSDRPGQSMTKFGFDHSSIDQTRDQAIIRFCFQYQIESVLSDLRASICVAIKNKSLPSFLSWLKFFHGIKNHGESEPFANEINLLLDSIVENNRVEEYLKSITDYSQKEVISDQTYIMRKLSSKVNTQKLPQMVVSKTKKGPPRA